MSQFSLNEILNLKMQLERFSSKEKALHQELETILNKLLSIFEDMPSEELTKKLKSLKSQSKGVLYLLLDLISFLEKTRSSHTFCALPEKAQQEHSQPSSNELNLSKVQFSAVAPEVFTKGESSLIHIVMYEDEFKHIVDELKHNSDASTKETKSGIYAVEKNNSIKIVLSSPDIVIEDDVEEFVWAGGYLNFSYVVSVPETYEKKQVLFIATVYINGFVVTKLKILAKSISLSEQKIELARNDVRSAFVSYASQDRSIVARLIQGMKKVSPDMNVFLDVENLRSGENWEETLKREIKNRDVFFLCWSKNAKQSSWVDMEWRYALANKGVEGIEPIPLEPPNQCPPPEELKSKHFNDSLLYIIDGSKTSVSTN